MINGDNIELSPFMKTQFYKLGIGLMKNQSYVFISTIYNK